jgi:hypothetical protein
VKTIGLIAVSLLLVACGESDYDRDGYRKSSSYSSDEFDSQLNNAYSCNSLSGEERRECLISYLSCAAITRVITCDD